MRASLHDPNWIMNGKGGPDPLVNARLRAAGITWINEWQYNEPDFAIEALKASWKDSAMNKRIEAAKARYAEPWTAKGVLLEAESVWPAVVAAGIGAYLGTKVSPGKALLYGGGTIAAGWAYSLAAFVTPLPLGILGGIALASVGIGGVGTGVVNGARKMMK